MSNGNGASAIAPPLLPQARHNAIIASRDSGISSPTSEQPDQELQYDSRPEYGDNEVAGQERPTAEYTALFENPKNWRNLETLQTKAREFSLLDTQPNAKKVAWDSQESVVGLSATSRPDEEDENSEDGGFQVDERYPDLSRRKKNSTARTMDSREESSRKRVKSNNGSGHQRTRPATRDRAQEAVPAPTASGAGSRNSVREPLSPDNGDDSDSPPPTITQISLTARANVAAARRAKGLVQKRTPWSLKDTDYLVKAIEQYGCSWSFLDKQPDWEVKRDQVALKDKARNLKVQYLKQGLLHSYSRSPD